MKAFEFADRRKNAGQTTPDDVVRFVLSPVHFMNNAFPTCYVMTAPGDFLVRQPDFLLPALEKLKIKHVFKVFGSDQNKLSHVFHCDPRLPDARLCNDEEMGFLGSLCTTKGGTE